MAQAERLEDIAGRDGNAGIDQHARHFRQRQRQQRFADAGHDACVRGEANRHIGAGQLRHSGYARIVRRELVRQRQQPQRRRGIRRAAADAGRDRQHLVEDELPRLKIVHALAQQPRRLEHEIVRSFAAVSRARTDGREAEFGPGRERQPVGAIAKRHHAFKVVKTVDAAADHPERQVDLCARLVGQRRHRRTSPSISRPCRLLFSCRRTPRRRCPPAGHSRSWLRSSAVLPAPA